MKSMGCCAMPLPGGLAGVGGAFVVQRPGGTSISAEPIAGTSAAVNRWSASMQGVALEDLVAGVSQHIVSQVDGEEQPATSMRLAAMMKGVRVLGGIGVDLGSLFS